MVEPIGNSGNRERRRAARSSKKLPYGGSVRYNWAPQVEVLGNPGSGGKDWKCWKKLARLEKIRKPAVSPKGGRLNYEHFNSQM